MGHGIAHIALVITLLGISSVSALAQKAGEEITYPSKSFAKLDTFEGLNLEDADKLYGKRDYKGAYAAYKAFSFEFAKSRALPYVLLRMGRCLHQLGKRHAAIKAYQDVVDYFPDDVRYAAASLYYIGQCHQQNGDTAKQTAVWARMVKDDDYVAEPNSGSALVHLANAMDKLKKFEEATEYRWRTAVNFAQSNPHAAREAVGAVRSHYVSRKPSHEKLSEFWRETNGWGHRHGIKPEAEKNHLYWRDTFDTALRGGNKENACRYWARAFGDLFESNDELRIKLFSMQRVYENDWKSWATRMEKQFLRAPVTVDRVGSWVRHFHQSTPEMELAFAMKHGGPLMASAPANKLTKVFENMRWNKDKFFMKWVLPRVNSLKVDEKVAMMHQLHRHNLKEPAKSLLRQLNLSGMSDAKLREIGFFAANYLPEEDVMRYFAKMKDKMDAAKARFDYYGGDFNRHIRNADKALQEIPVLRKSTKYAGQDLSWKEALLWRKAGKYPEAIKAYRAANKQPDSTWAVTDCLVAMKQYGAAIKNVQGLESVKATASAACLKIADIYKAAGQKGKEVDQLRLVLRRYPKSGQSSTAHQRLESYGVSLIGGESKADE